MLANITHILTRHGSTGLLWFTYKCALWLESA